MSLAAALRIEAGYPGKGEMAVFVLEGRYKGALTA
jgi:hypothetical protein